MLFVKTGLVLISAGGAGVEAVPSSKALIGILHGLKLEIDAVVELMDLNVMIEILWIV